MAQSDFQQRVMLGKTNLQVSRLGLASGYGIDASGVEKAYHEFGINYFYWSSPRSKKFGEGLRNLAKNHREDMVVVLQTYDHIGFGVKWGSNRGLKALGFDYADVLLLGWFNWHPPNWLLNNVRELKAAGLVRHVAMSGHHRPLFARIAQDPDSPIDIFMIRYNAAHRGAESDIFPYLPAENPPGITIYTATRWGKLLNPSKMPPGEEPLSAADCYRFVLSNPHVDLCMMGPRSEDEMRGGLQALSAGPLNDEELRRIRRIGDFVHG